VFAITTAFHTASSFLHEHCTKGLQFEMQTINIGSEFEMEFGPKRVLYRHWTCHEEIQMKTGEDWMREMYYQ
jgi:hypothetical protein